MLNNRKETKKEDKLLRIQSIVDGLSTEEKEKIKADAISKIYTCGIIQKKINSLMYRYFLPIECDIQSDILHETFLGLSKYNTDKFLLAHFDLDNPNRMVGLAVRIMVMANCAKHSKKPDYPKHNFTKWVLFASNLNKIEVVNNTENESETTPEWDAINKNYDVNDDDNVDARMWIFVRENINEKENTLLDNHLNKFYKKPKMVGQENINYKQQNEEFLQKLKIIITQFKTNEKIC